MSTSYLLPLLPIDYCIATIPYLTSPLYYYYHDHPSPISLLLLLLPRPLPSLPPPIPTTTTLTNTSFSSLFSHKQSHSNTVLWRDLRQFPRLVFHLRANKRESSGQLGSKSRQTIRRQRNYDVSEKKRWKNNVDQTLKKNIAKILWSKMEKENKQQQKMARQNYLSCGSNKRKEGRKKNIIDTFK